MNEPFPFGLPAATAWYGSLYAITLLLHAVLLSYVLAGAGWVAVHALLRVRGATRGAGVERVAGLLGDWLPFSLGGAITLGVAPLLFLQILHREAFYTSNLLLFWRWMAVVPELIAGFYGLYLAKAERMQRARPLVRAALALCTWGAFVFVAASFTDQHVLALSRGSWVGVYRGGPLAWREPTVLLRLGVWLCGALPVMAALVAFQLRAAHARDGVPRDARRREVRLLAAVALVGLAGAGAMAAAYRSALPDAEAAGLVGPLVRPWLFVAVAGALAAAAAWIGAAWRGQLERSTLLTVSLGTVATMLGAVAAREALRLSGLDLGALSALHERAAKAGGLPVFVAFAVVNGAVLFGCVALVRRGLRAGPAGGAR